MSSWIVFPSLQLWSGFALNNNLSRLSGMMEKCEIHQFCTTSGKFLRFTYLPLKDKVSVFAGHYPAFGLHWNMQLTTSTAGPRCYSPPTFFCLSFETDSAWYMLALTGTNQGPEPLRWEVCQGRACGSKLLSICQTLLQSKGKFTWEPEMVRSLRLTLCGIFLLVFNISYM